VLIEVTMKAKDSTRQTTGRIQTHGRLATEAENWKLLNFFNIYRLMIAVAAVTISLVVGAFPPFGSASPGLFQLAGMIYAAFALVFVYTIRQQKPDFESQATVLAFADVILLTMLTHASGGLSSGLGLLLLVAVAGCSLMLGKRLTVFYASLATVAALLEHSWDLLTGAEITSSQVIEGYPHVGMLGIGLFATAYLGYTLASRLRATEALAERRGIDLANLAKINELVIQRMQSGVLVCDPGGHLRMINQAAKKFLGLSNAISKKTSLSDLSPDLAIQLFQWQGKNPGERARRMVSTQAGYALLPRFVFLGETKDSGTLIFLEDMAILKQQAQQLKMSALARLTASIAHEIRNPLGAITNAAQLLSETPHPDNESRRLTKIIDEQSRRMNVIVENVTQLSRRDRVNPVRLALAPWLGDFVHHQVESKQTQKEAFTIIGAEAIEACVDPDQLHQVVMNLCQNALRNSPPFTGTPVIKLQAGKDPEGRPILDVIDWGKGVPPEIVDNIFDPFFTTTPKGTGLGLYIARELCEGNGASLDYYPGDGGIGSRFRVAFARAEECSQLDAL
jgi:two-component system, NtrC family, sensor histidine kinase PilS